LCSRVNNDPDPLADSGAQIRISRIEALGHSYSLSDFLYADRLAVRRAQRVENEPRQFVVTEIVGTFVVSLWPKRRRIETFCEKAERSVYMSQIDSILIDLPL
jgi:hypothetical protein